MLAGALLLGGLLPLNMLFCFDFRIRFPHIYQRLQENKKKKQYGDENHGDGGYVAGKRRRRRRRNYTYAALRFLIRFSFNYVPTKSEKRTIQVDSGSTDEIHRITRCEFKWIRLPRLVPHGQCALCVSIIIHHEMLVGRRGSQIVDDNDLMCSILLNAIEYHSAINFHSGRIASARSSHSQCRREIQISTIKQLS